MESPDVIKRGDQITLNINDLNDGSQFSLLIEGQFSTPASAAFTFETDNFNMPFTLNNGQISATTHGTTVTGLYVQKGDSIVAVRQRADNNGDFTFSQPYTVSTGLYDYLKLSGTTRSDTTMISTQMNLLGTKKGLTNSQITFTVNGIDNGQVRLIVFVDNEQKLFKTVTVGNGIPVPTTTATTAIPTTTATTVVTTRVTTATTTQTTTATTTQPGANQTETTTTTQTTTATTTQPGANQTETTTTTQAGVTETTIPGSTTAPMTQATSSATTATPSVPPKTFYSADRKVYLTTYGVDYAALLMVSQTSIPDSWLMVSKPYTIAPDSLAFSPPATISFTNPESGNDYAYFIGRRLTSDWSAVHSTAGTGTIDGEVDLAGTYALMAFKPESTIQPTVTGTAQATTPTPLVTVTTKPKIASIAQASSSPTAAPTRTPLDIMVVTGALAIGVALFTRARR